MLIRIIKARCLFLLVLFLPLVSLFIILPGIPHDSWAKARTHSLQESFSVKAPTHSFNLSSLDLRLFSFIHLHYILFVSIDEEMQFFLRYSLTAAQLKKETKGKPDCAKSIQYSF